MPIGDVTVRATSANPAKLTSHTFCYIDLSSVDQNAKEISAPKILPVQEAPSRARQVIAPGDILVSTVRPNLNGVAQVSPTLEGAIASTGFTVLRSKSKLIDSNYLFHWVKSPAFVFDMVSKSTGASYPAVSDKIVRESLVPLPIVDEQRRIAAILDKADELRAKRRQAIAHLDALTQSIFHSMFGSPSPTSAELAIEDLAASPKGAIRTGPFGSQLLTSEFTDDGVAVLGIDNAVTNTFAWAQRRYISEEKYDQLRRYRVWPGDLLITIMGTLGRCAVVPRDVPKAINTKHLCCITLNRDLVVPEWLHAYFLQSETARSYLRQTTKGAIMGGLNMGIIKNMPVSVPPLALQQTFANRVAAVERLKETHRKHLAELDALFASLQSRAFKGEL
ncbi:restriction endonuclease subunit S [Paenarthrobacter nicotinovorans]|uniref:restriction endonuclease subunit S n=1 Tax=Paenarthrobacter nicotinovorans TaxID=29320 RepID=UPI003DA6C88C